MISIILYCVLLFGLLVYSYKAGSSIFGKNLCWLYFVCGLCSIFVVYDPFLSHYGIQFPFDLDFVPYLYLVICYGIYFFPFLRKGLNAHVYGITTENSPTYVLFAYFFVFCTVISIGCYFSSNCDLIRSGDWVGNRNLFVDNNLPLPYTNELLHWCMRVAWIFRHVAFILAFTFLKGRRREGLAFALIAASGLNILSNAIYGSSRGTLFIEGIVFLSIFFLFFRYLARKLRNFLTILLCVCGSVVLLLAILITVSRYSNSGSFRSVVEYFGEAPLFFNYALWDIDHYTWGEFGWGKLFGMEYIDVDFVRDKLLTSFYTFVGWSYFDWGPIGTIILGVLLNVAFVPLFKKKKWQISDLYILVAYYGFLVNGVFVIGCSHCKEIVANVIAFVIVKFVVEKIHLKLRNPVNQKCMLILEKGAKSYLL